MKLFSILCAFALESDIEKRLFDFFLELSLYLLHKDEILYNISFCFLYLFLFAINEETINIGREKIDTYVECYHSENDKRHESIVQTEYIGKCMKIFRIVLEYVRRRKHIF